MAEEAAILHETKIMELSAFHISRRRWSSAPLQLGGAIALCVVAPFLVYSLLLPAGMADQQALQAMLATLASVIGGFWLNRGVTALPGTKQSATILPSYLASFGLVFAVILIARIDYSRALLISGFLLTIAYFFAFYMLTQRRTILRLGIIDSERCRPLHSLAQVSPVILSPGSDVTELDAVTADLRYDHDPVWERRICDFVLSGIPVYHARDLLESLTGRCDLHHLAENDLGSLAPMATTQLVKRVADFSVALPLLIVMTPFLMLIAIVIRMDSPGPAFFRQKRIGYRGRPFTVFKFRTMTDGAAGDGGDRDAFITREHDTRITRLGQFLRRTRIDELPQIINILRGEMSIIGPRPEAAQLVEWYEKEIPFYRYRHAVVPGITGWAQVTQGHVAEISDVTEKLQYDFYYIRNFSIWLDLLILVKTVKTMLTGFGSK